MIVTYKSSCEAFELDNTNRKYFVHMELLALLEELEKGDFVLDINVRYPTPPYPT